MERRTFPLVPRRRPVGLPFGDQPSRRRGPGSDVIGSRPYRPGDPVSTIDWFASARLSAARRQEEFVVRDRSADEAPRVAIVCDRRPAMGIYRSPFPWLSKARALSEATAAVAASAAAARSDVAALDYAGANGRGGQPYWLAPGRRDVFALTIERQASSTTRFDAPEDNVERALVFLSRLRRSLPPGSFVFCLSDFLVGPRTETWLAALARGWDVVPVVIQDPVWEQSFPQIGSVLVPVADARGERVRLVRLSRGEAARRRAANERRLEELLGALRSVGADPVLVGTADPHAVDEAFLTWAEGRRRARWRR
jgi:uncharacterized protein (DUF58 family)